MFRQKDLEDAFALKLNPDGAAVDYALLVGGESSDWGTSIAVDQDGAAYLAGNTWSVNFPVTPGAFDTTCGTDGTIRHW